jgi:hypothetical protein
MVKKVSPFNSKLLWVCRLQISNLEPVQFGKELHVVEMTRLSVASPPPTTDLR